MSCGSCVEKLAKKLMVHHKIDMIRAYELAEKGVERTEHRIAEPKILSGAGNPSDYSQTCNNCGKNCSCFGVEDCTVSTDCQAALTCVGSSCCPAPLPNSHLVSNGCTDVTPGYRCSCRTYVCGGTCLCAGHGSCTYDCEEGYVWNPVTLKCEIPFVPSGGQGNLAVIALSVVHAWLRRRRKRRFIATLK